MKNANFEDLMIATDVPVATPELGEGGSQGEASESPEADTQGPLEASSVVDLDLGVDLEYVESDANMEKLSNAFAEKVPSSWNIMPKAGDTIVATHIANGAIFVGSIKEFNTILRS